MSIRKIFAAALVCAAAATTAFGQTVDPCTKTTPLTGGTKLNITNEAGDQGMGFLEGTPFHYELWFNKNENNNPNLSMEWYGANQGGGAAFKATWNNPNQVNILARTGYYWNTGGPYTQYKNIYCDFSFAIEGTGGGWSYFGIYGWSRNPNASEENNKLIEFYIVDNWFGSSQLGPNTFCNGCSEKGTFEIDGGTYKIYTNIRYGQPSIDGNKNFLQIFSVRQYTTNSGPTSRRTCGTISVTEHFKKWESLLNLALGNMYEAKFKTEIGGGTGSFDARYLSFSQEDFARGSIPAGNFGIIASASPVSGGSVDINPKASYHSSGSSVQLTATAATGWEFDGWSGGGASGKQNPLTVTMDANKIITAKFLPTDLDINLVKDGNFPANSVTTNAGGSQSWSLNSGSYFGSGNNSAATHSINNGNLVISGITTGAEVYMPQLIQKGISLDEGMTYQLSFTASAAAARTLDFGIQMSGTPYTNYTPTAEPVNLTATPTTFEYNFKMTNPSDQNAQLSFNLGSSTQNVTISGVKLGYFVDQTSVSDKNIPQANVKKSTLKVTAKKSVINVRFKAQNSGTAELRLYGLKGNLIIKANLQTVAGKTYTHAFNAGKLANGFYVVSVQSNGSVERSKVIMPK